MRRNHRQLPGFSLGWQGGLGSIRQNKEAQSLQSTCGSFWPPGDPISHSPSEPQGNSAPVHSFQAICICTFFPQKLGIRKKSYNWERQKLINPPNCHQDALASFYTAALWNILTKGRVSPWRYLPPFWGCKCLQRWDSKFTNGFVETRPSLYLLMRYIGRVYIIRRKQAMK